MTRRDEESPRSSEGPEQLIRYAFTDLVEALQKGGPRYAGFINKAMNFKSEVLDNEPDPERAGDSRENKGGV